MNIVVCMKYVSPPMGIDDLCCMNPYDLYALQQAVLMKRMNPNIHITVITMAPKSAIPMLKNAIAVGCDDAVLVTDKAFAGADTLATSTVLFKAMAHIKTPHVILCGEKSIDGETGFVGIALAYRLNYQYLSNVIELEKITETEVVVKTEDLQYENMIEANLPIVLSFRKFDLNKGSFSLRRQKLANQYTPLVLSNKELNIDSSCCGLTGSFTNVLKISNVLPLGKRNVLMVNGVDDGISRIMKEFRSIGQ